MNLWNSTRAELGRLSRRRAGWLLVLLPALIATLRIVGSTNPPADGDEASTNGFVPLADGLHAGGAMLTLVVVLIGSLLVVRERESGSLGLASLICSRGGVFLSKMMTLSLIVLGMTIVWAGSAVAVAASCFELGPIVEDGFEMATAQELWRDVAFSVAAALPSWIAIGSFSLLISTSVSTTGAAVAIGLIPLVLFDFVQGLLGDSWRHVFFTHLPFLGGDSPLAMLPEIARGYSDVFFEPGQLMHASTVSLWQGALLIGIGWWWTRKRTLA